MFSYSSSYSGRFGDKHLVSFPVSTEELHWVSLRDKVGETVLNEAREAPMIHCEMDQFWLWRGLHFTAGQNIKYKYLNVHTYAEY